MKVLAALIGLGLLAGCNAPSSNTPSNQSAFFEYQSPSHFPEILIPNDNQPTKAKIDLGKKLFFDNILSKDSTKSCASCHHAEHGLADTLALSEGVSGKTLRNAPSLMNVAFFPHFMREGAVPTLELQVLSPLEGENEMHLNIMKACERLNSNASYKSAFVEVFGTEATPFAVTRAIAAYERTFIGGNSKFDAFIQGDSGAFTAVEKLGFDLFQGNKLNCSACHSGVLLTNFEIVNNGLLTEYNDRGLARITQKKEDVGKFSVPSLRNVAVTGPYMFDGRLESLEEVIDHYAEGTKNQYADTHLIKGFEISKEEKKAVIAFLETLTEQYSN